MSEFPPFSPPGTPKEHQALLATHLADHRRLEAPNVASNYGTLDSEADTDIDETDGQSRGSDEEEQHQRKDAAMTEDPAIKEGRKSVMKAAPALVTGVRETYLSCSLLSSKETVTEGHCSQLQQFRC